MKKTSRIAVAVEKSSAYGRSFIRGVADFAGGRPDWDLTLIDPRGAASRIDGEYDGYICRLPDARPLAMLAKLRRPVVDCLCIKPYSTFATVRPDTEAIGRLAAEHFMARRFANFAFCGYRGIDFSDRRRNVFAMLLEKKGIRPSIYRPPMHPKNRFGRDFVLGDRVDVPPDADDLAKWLERLPKPVGVFCCDDLRSSQVAAVCRTLGLSVPGDVAMLGVDNDPVYCAFSTPRLSSIDPDSVRIGRAAAQALAQMLDDPASAPQHVVVPPKGVVARESTNVYPGAPRWLPDALSFIGENAAKGISASDVFAHVGFSRTLVEKAFKKTLSRTVQQEIQAERIAEAKRLLATTFLSVKEVALQSGFSSIEYFSRMFAAATGATATVWRERNAEL